ncbi:NADP-dependent oxidoreductase [Fructilactobacillus cliffordii]|uniref:NADP-dependent oxidoreductase n=1 Tax=Fructilactobacillus cliffordii TaxID=2940299 RepID=A0A9Q9E1Z1_9LACO|nr:NADP-dependent oxidoreductase [Fructilactobacillus cliffordii]USS89240.1 NADP-dependent oxidoreductase [Fructilactobacillus cliffordii]
MKIPTQMKAFRFNRYGDPAENQRIPVPEIGADEVLVYIHNAGLNPVDYKVQAGKMKMIFPFHLPLTMGNEFAGEVAQVGSNVQDFQVGDQVYGRPDNQHTGTLADYIALDQNEIARFPAELDFQSASGVPLTGLTSYQALVELGHIQPGQKVFIQAGAGGIGTMAIQIAKALGAYVTTTASPQQTALVRSLGADQVLNYHETYFADVLFHYDMVFDTLGGQYLKDSFKILKPGGHLVTINGLPTYEFGQQHHLGMAKSLLFAVASAPLQRLAKKYHVHYDFLIMHPSGAQLQILSQMIANEKLLPIIDQIYDFGEAQAAYDYLESGHAHGKVIVNVNH